MKKILYGVTAIIVVIAFGLVVFQSPNNTLAQISGLSTPFGGRVIMRISCTCSLDTLLIVGLPVGGSFILSPGSRVYRNYAPFPPNWVLGTASGFSTCFVLIPTTPPSCVPAGSGPIIRIMGTS